MVDELRNTWDEEDRELSVAAFPYTPSRTPGWLDRREFRVRLELALERHRRDRMRFELHLLEFPDVPAAIAALCGWLPAQLRDMDCLTRPSTNSVLLLMASAPEGFPHVRRRLLALWDTAWRDSGGAPPAPALTDRYVTLAGPEDADAFLHSAAAWLEQH
jgi:hypothetical protein